jgi:GTP cyclohydrolase IA
MTKAPPDLDAAKQAMARFLEALGYELDDPDLSETPARVVDAYVNELLVGERTDLQQLIEQGSLASDSDSLVIVRDIAVAAMCPHHLLPAQGYATVAYLPGERVLGLGTVAHLVNACSRRLALQERIGQAVTEALMNLAGARGAYCWMRLEHACLRLRGARQTQALVETVHVNGLLKDPEPALQLGIALGARRGEHGCAT